MENLAKILFILFLCFGTASLAQTKDTILVKKVLRAGSVEDTYLIYRDTSWLPNKMVVNGDFIFNKDDYNSNYNLIKNKKIIQQAKPKIPKKWYHLELYKNEYYTYHSLEIGFYKFELTDSAMINFYMDGPYPSIYKKIIKNTPTEFFFVGINNVTKDSIRIKMIDSKLGIAIKTIFYYTNGVLKKHHTLLVDAYKAMHFKTIVNEAEQVGMYEFDEFDKPNYEELLKNAK